MKFFGWKQSEASSQTKEYFALPTSSHNETEIVRPQNPSKSIRVTIIAVISFILFLSLFILLHIDRTPKHQESHLDCGSSREAALQNGCKFDPMSFSWLQPACYDSELTSEFLALKSWRWTVDRAGMEEVSLGEVMEGSMNSCMSHGNIIYCIARICGGRCVEPCWRGG